MRKTPLPQFRKKTKADVNAEVVARLKKPRLAQRIPLQTAGTKLGVAMSTLYWMEQGVSPMTAEQAEILFASYAQSACAIAEDVAAVLKS